MIKKGNPISEIPRSPLSRHIVEQSRLSATSEVAGTTVIAVTVIAATVSVHSDFAMRSLRSIV